MKGVSRRFWSAKDVGRDLLKTRTVRLMSRRTPELNGLRKPTVGFQSYFGRMRKRKRVTRAPRATAAEKAVCEIISSLVTTAVSRCNVSDKSVPIGPVLTNYGLQFIGGKSQHQVQSRQYSPLFEFSCRRGPLPMA